MGKRKTRKTRTTSSASADGSAISEGVDANNDEVREHQVPMASEAAEESDGVSEEQSPLTEHSIQQNESSSRSLDTEENPPPQSSPRSPLPDTSEHSLELFPESSPTQEKESQSPVPGHLKPPWLNPFRGGGGGPTVSSDEGFDMNASFVTSNFDMATVASDTDDDSQNREAAVSDDERTAESAEEKLAQVLSQQGIRIDIVIEEDEKSWGELSDMSVGNQSYIMDLALQKGAREKNLKEECMEEALVLYREAKKEGHGGESFFLMMVEEITKKKKASKAEYYRIQDERLDRALDEELLRRERMAALSTGSLQGTAVSTSSLLPGLRRTSERVNDFIEEREKGRMSIRSMAGADPLPTSREAIIRAASETVIEMTENGDYEWGNDDESDDDEPTKVKKKKVKKKKKEKSRKLKTKRNNTKKSSASSESKPKTEGSASQNQENNPKKSKAKKTKKSRKNDQTASEFANHSDAPPVEETVQDSTIPAKPKKVKKKGGKPKKSKGTKDKLKAKNDSLSGTVSMTASEGNDAVEESGRRDSPADIPMNHDREQKRLSHQSVAIDAMGRPTIPPKKSSTGQQVGRLSSVSNKIPVRKRISRVLSAICRDKSRPSLTDEAPKEGVLFRRRKSQGNVADPADRLLPIPGSQLGAQ